MTGLGVSSLGRLEVQIAAEHTTSRSRSLGLRTAASFRSSGYAEFSEEAS
jgi:hypothetical protein